MRNVELKARDPDPARTLERALALGADDRGEFRQRDTYFAGADGRLKLREHEAGGSPMWDELIEYSHELIGYAAGLGRGAHEQLPPSCRSPTWRRCRRRSTPRTGRS